MLWIRPLQSNEKENKEVNSSDQRKATWGILDDVKHTCRGSLKWKGIQPILIRMAALITESSLLKTVKQWLSVIGRRTLIVHSSEPLVITSSFRSYAEGKGIQFSSADSVWMVHLVAVNCYWNPLVRTLSVNEQGFIPFVCSSCTVPLFLFCGLIPLLEVSMTLSLYGNPPCELMFGSQVSGGLIGDQEYPLPSWFNITFSQPQTARKNKYNEARGTTETWMKLIGIWILIWDVWMMVLEVCIVAQHKSPKILWPAADVKLLCKIKAEPVRNTDSSAITQLLCS